MKQLSALPNIIIDIHVLLSSILLIPPNTAGDTIVWYDGLWFVRKLKSLSSDILWNSQPWANSNHGYDVLCCEVPLQGLLSKNSFKRTPPQDAYTICSNQFTDLPDFIILLVCSYSGKCPVSANLNAMLLHHYNLFQIIICIWIFCTPLNVISRPT